MRFLIKYQCECGYNEEVPVPQIEVQGRMLKAEDLHFADVICPNCDAKNKLDYLSVKANDEHCLGCSGWKKSFHSDFCLCDCHQDDDLNSEE